MGRSQLKATFEEEAFPSQVEIRAGTVEAASPRARLGRGQDWPLSFGQQRLWFLDQLEPNTALYNMPCVARLRGRFDKRAFQAALNDLAARHAVLRTRFICEGEHPRQAVEPDLEMP